MKRTLAVLVTLLLAMTSVASAQTTTSAQAPAFLASSSAKLEQELVAKYGDDARPRLHRGLAQVAQFWRADDGDAATFEEFVRTNFAGTQKDELFNRMEFIFEQLDGHMLEIGREFRRQADVELGPILPVDEVLAGYEPSAHINDDFFANKVAFTILLNFPLTTLEERLTQGDKWSRREWAEVRLAQRFSRRVPADVSLAFSQAIADSEAYVAGYNIWMHHVVDDKGTRLFQPKLRLLSHWNLRDEIKADYSDPKNGLAKQRAIEKVMDRIVTQTIPQVVIDNPSVDWNPWKNTVTVTTSPDSDRKAPANVTSDREPDARYQRLLANFHAAQKLDPYTPTAPTQVARAFEGMEIPETRVKSMFEQVLASPLVAQTSKLIEKRLGRKLEPFDIWYNGFRPRGQYTEEQLDAIVAKKYPTAEAYKADIPNLLTGLGFSKERATMLADNIIVDPARGSGHAMPAARRADKTHLRTRVEPGGMNYKGYNIAVHEMGHNVEQTFSLDLVDHTLLSGVPNTAFTEALAFTFQNRDLELLGLSKPTARSEAEKTLNDFWGTYEIAGVGLVDIAVWRWMYDHPKANASELRDATVQIAKDVWNKYYAPVFHKKDVALLAIYSHMLNYPMYLMNYPVGHMIAFQIEQQMEKAGNVGAEFERMATYGSVAPDLWMKHATGAPVGPDALLAATKKALADLEK